MLGWQVYIFGGHTNTYILKSIEFITMKKTYKVEVGTEEHSWTRFNVPEIKERWLPAACPISDKHIVVMGGQGRPHVDFEDKSNVVLFDTTTRTATTVVDESDRYSLKFRCYSRTCQVNEGNVFSLVANKDGLYLINYQLDSETIMIL